MNDTDEVEAGPSAPKRMKISQNNKRASTKKFLTDDELQAILEASSDSDVDIYLNDGSEDSSSESGDEDESIFDFQQTQTVSTNKDEFQWTEDSGSMKSVQFTKEEKMLIPIPGKEPIDFFMMFLTHEFLESIVEQTNIYATEVFLSKGTKEKSRITNWKETTNEEMIVFLGLLLHMGNIRMSRLQDYWKTDPLFNINIFHSSMSRNRFLLIMRTLHFAKNPEPGEAVPQDRLHKIRPPVRFFNERMSKIFYPGRELSLDESMMLWRGRLVFRQYIKNKRHKYGIKLYMLTDPNGIILKFMVYTGSLDDCGGKGHTEKVVLHLLDGKLNVGHSLYMDNFYNSPALAKTLLKQNTHCTGTLRIDRKDCPTEVKQKKLKRGETIARYSGGILVGKWKDKRDVCYISNEYENTMLNVTNRRGDTREKPLPIIQYNTYMAGVDRQDQLLSYYPCERKTIRWPTKIFVHILQMMLINAHGLYNKYSGKKMNLYDFRVAVIRKLLPTQTVVQENQPKLDAHYLVKREEKTSSGKIKRKACKTCYKKNKRTDTTYVCQKSPGLPGNCLDCATLTHE